MSNQKGNPVSQGSASRAPKVLISLAAMNTPENTNSALSLQLAFLSRRVGSMDPATIAAIASLAFPATGAR